MKKENLKKIQEKVLKIALEIAKKGEGALFVIGDDVEYSQLIKQKFEKFNIYDNGASKLLASIATIDGAVIISKKGDVMAYGAMIKKARPFIGYGTRHAAAFSASRGGNIAILCSEEERKVKVFKNGRFIMQLDALQRGIDKNIPRIASFLESIGVGFIGIIGVSVLVPTAGISLIPGVLMFGASHYVIKKFVSLRK